MLISKTPRYRQGLLVVSLFVLSTCLVSAQRFPVYKNLHNFGGTVTNADGKTGPDGLKPESGITFDSTGNAFGTSSSGGANGGNCGNVWEVTTSGKYIDLHDFGGTVKNSNGKSGPDGTSPLCSVEFDSNGNMYGTTLNGGANNFGTVWEITKSGAYLDLHDFGGQITDSQGQTANDGINPQANVTIDSAGNIYGTAQAGGAYRDGIVWEITSTGEYRDLHDFGLQYSEGSESLGGVAIDKSGNIFGTTVYGGVNAQGTLWKLSKTGAFQKLHDFGGKVKNADGKSGPDGTVPSATVTIDSDGNILGTTPNGGPSDKGIVWELTASGAYLDLHDFGGTIINSNGQSGPDGTHPLSAVTLGADGNIYGSASVGGPYDEDNGNNGAGMVWELTKSGTYIDVFDVGGPIENAGFGIPGAIAFDGNGDLFGVSFLGGANFSGTFWELGALAISSVTVSPASVVGSQTATGTVTLNGLAVSGGTSVALVSNTPNATVPASITVAEGSKTATFSIGTLAVGAASAATITASLAGFSQTTTLTVTPAKLTNFTLSPTTVVGGISSVGTITLEGPAPTGGTVISLSSNSSSLSTPTSVTIPAGKTTATFDIQTTQVNAITTGSIAAKLAGTVLNASLTINPLAVVSVTVSPSSVTGGLPSTGTITLNGPAGASGVTIKLSSSSIVVVTVPASLTIPPGESSVTFPISTSAVTTQQTTTIGVTFASATQSTTLIVVPLTLQSVSLSPSTITGGAMSTGTVTLNGPATASGLVVKLKSSSPSATLPATVSIAAGKTSATFTVKTTAVGSIKSLTITGTLGTVSRTATLTINPPVLELISFNPATVVGLTASKGTVTLTGTAPSGGIIVKLSSNNNAVIVPLSVTVPGGSSTATFSAKTLSVASQVVGTVTGTQGSATKTATLTVNPPVLKSLTLSPSTVVGGKSSTGIVTLGSAAPSGGIGINLASGSNNASVPKSVTVPAGATSAKFKISTTAVTASTKVAISASLGSVTVSANLTITK